MDTQRCLQCRHSLAKHDQYGAKYYFCFFNPNEGRWIAEIKECPQTKEQKQHKPVDLSYLIDWYITSVDEKEQPVWTEEHLKELLKDFILIPKPLNNP